MYRPTCVLFATASSIALLASAVAATAQQPAADASPIGHTSAKEVQVSGAVEVRDGQMLLGNGSAITAGAQAVSIALTRGGQLRLCSTTAVHLSHDRSIDAPDSSALMMALDRGAIETNYDTGKYSDVLLTPDLRILISPPGHADISIRVNSRGDTCVDNPGANAPYITVTSQFDGGLYRLTPNQHVTFERGSLKDVVDTEREPCGCPAVPPVSVVSAGSTSSQPAMPGKPVGGPSSTPADTDFPLAESEGLAPPPPLPTTPVAKPGEVHAQVTVPLTYNGDNPAPPKSTDTPDTAASPTAPPPSAPPVSAKPPAIVPQPPSAPASAPPAQAPALADTATPAQATAPGSTPASKGNPGIFRKIGHFFARVFG